MLVIVNPGGLAALAAARAAEGRPPEEQVTAVQAASLSDDEVSAVVAWLKAGGSALLIAEHPPYVLAAAKLAAQLGIQNWPDGSTRVPEVAEIFFWRTDFYPGGEPGHAEIEGPRRRMAYQGADAVLARHSITEGRGTNEQIQRVVTFSGSLFKLPPGGEPLLTLPTLPLDKSRPRRPDGSGWLQGAVMEVGKGRLALFGDGGLFSGGSAADNRQFVLNVMHWLSRVL